jgi:hypothetical protein
MTTAATKSKLSRTALTDPRIALLEIIHSSLSEPLRCCNDTQSVIRNGNTYVALPFSVVRPDQVENQSPIATLTIDNIGQELTDAIERNGGLKGAKARIMEVFLSDPDTAIFDVTMDLNGIGVNWQSVTGKLSFENLLDKPSIQLTYRPDTAPGVF